MPPFFCRVRQTSLPRKKRLAILQTELKHLAKARKAQEQLLEQARKVDTTLAEQRKLLAMVGRQLESAQFRQGELDGRLATRKQARDAYTRRVSNAAEIETAYATWPP